MQNDNSPLTIQRGWGQWRLWAQRQPLEELPQSLAQFLGTCLHDTVHLSLKLNGGIWDLMSTFQGNVRRREAKGMQVEP